MENLENLDNLDIKIDEDYDDEADDSGEKKATKLSQEKLLTINSFLADINGICRNSKKIIEANIETFTKLSEKFPNIAVFEDMLARNKKLLSRLNAILEKSKNGQYEITQTMNILLYQSTYNNKIERAANAMGILRKYMNNLFKNKNKSGKDPENLVSEKEIETLVEDLCKK